jgi:hypothetical protein
MRSMLGKIALAAMVAGLPASAFATGNLDCGIDDANLKFTFESLFGHGVISPLLQPRTSFESKNPNIHKTLQSFETDGSFLKQQWFEGRDLKLLFYAETEGDGVPFASVKLKIEAVQPPDEDFAYAGKYELVIQPPVSGDTTPDPVTLVGDVGCSAG